MTGSDPPVQVVLVDDEPLLRQSLAMIIHAEPGLAVVGEAGDGVEGIAVVKATAPDVVIMDVRMPRLDGIEATRGICRLPELGHTRVLVLSMFDLDEYVFHALRAGASGFLLKDSRPDDLLNAIRRTHGGESLFAPSILARLVEHHVYKRPAAGAVVQSGLDRLTAREIEVRRGPRKSRSRPAASSAVGDPAHAIDAISPAVHMGAVVTHGCGHPTRAGRWPTG